MRRQVLLLALTLTAPALACLGGDEPNQRSDAVTYRAEEALPHAAMHRDAPHTRVLVLDRDREARPAPDYRSLATSLSSNLTCGS